MSDNDKPVLVLGSTGLQGGATARALLKAGIPVRALTRDPDSGAARALAAAGATLVKGDLDDRESLRAAMAGVRGVFSVQTFVPPAGVEGEERQGKAVADIAAQTSVPHLVYSSVEGAQHSSGIPHFDSKWHVEQHIRELGVPTTVLRPVYFMENLTGMTRGGGDGAVFQQPLGADVPIQIVATADIGSVAAAAFARPADHIGRDIGVAGDELTGSRIAETISRVTGVPTRYEAQSIEQARAFSDDLAAMFQWFADTGFDVDIPALRRDQPGLRSLDDWLRDSGWKPAAAG
ncbi:MAG TPA: NmrA/HSCARG family protein [Stackebrandtia sp.]|jgi:uncharacterized protein YbjT (DUF2867 family)|uniref:NmrA/HSCARG family protein n=1 Tax=Stackebrandtia sp. TaxID=2023065 RepID=UPI002D760D6B|nr:NmrA/HSCARG family protein [Stackebrandtia sp.]HZE40084.1 NmrA/HSCARG family protein [Stackebrandtia sp.]